MRNPVRHIFDFLALMTLVSPKSSANSSAAVGAEDLASSSAAGAVSAGIASAAASGFQRRRGLGLRFLGCGILFFFSHDGCSGKGLGFLALGAYGLLRPLRVRALV